MARVLITGASGLLGLNLAIEAQRAGHTVFGVTGSRQVALEGVRMMQADLLDGTARARMWEAAAPEWVVHCAALADLEACEREPERAQALNADLPGTLAAEAKAAGARFVHISTDAVFDGERGDYTEEDAPNPLSVYAETKLAGEGAVASANPAALVARVNLFGWSLSGQRSLGEFFVNGLRAGAPLKGFTDVYFSPLLVNDLAGLLFQMFEKDLHGLYHVLSRDSMSKYAFGVRIAELFGYDPAVIAPISVKDAGLAARRSPNLTLKTDKLAAALGHPLPGIDEGLARFHALYEAGYPARLKAAGEIRPE
ncbi:MAG: SDR family oxidoreductase [Chloroflexi bacterium]|nr:SDR family oxidoreductase [Chloroflexota bacterium]